MGLGLDKRDQIESQKFYVCVLYVLIHLVQSIKLVPLIWGRLSPLTQYLAPKDLKFAALFNSHVEGCFWKFGGEHKLILENLRIKNPNPKFLPANRTLFGELCYVVSMKRPISWSDKNDDDESDSSSCSDSEYDSNQTKPQGNSGTGRRKTGAIDFDTLKRHGYKGGLSVLSVPPPKDDKEPDWSWSSGKEAQKSGEAEESYQERQKTRAAIKEAEQLTNVQTMKDKKGLSFSQKEKRKRDLGQASRGKNYVEEEKRQLRESGIYSGFDS